MSLTIPKRLKQRRTYGICGCGARITQCSNATRCIICSGIARERDNEESERRSSKSRYPIPNYGTKAPRYMDGEKVDE